SLRVLIRDLCRVVRPDGADGLSDAQLLEQFVSRRDEAAFELLLWRYGPMVLGTCRRVLKHADDVEDAFQATFLALVRKADLIDTRQAVGGWLYGVAYHPALLARRRSADRSRHERQAPLRLVVAEGSALRTEDLRDVLDEEVDRLPEKYRLPFVLCCLQGRTNEAAARRLGRP